MAAEPGKLKFCRQAAGDRGLFVSLAADRFQSSLTSDPEAGLSWVTFAILVLIVQIPLVGVGWLNVINAVTVCNERMTRLAMIAIAAIRLFCAQVFSSVAEGRRL